MGNPANYHDPLGLARALFVVGKLFDAWPVEPPPKAGIYPAIVFWGDGNKTSIAKAAAKAASHFLLDPSSELFSDTAESLSELMIIASLFPDSCFDEVHLVSHGDSRGISLSQSFTGRLDTAQVTAFFMAMKPKLRAGLVACESSRTVGRSVARALGMPVTAFHDNLSFAITKIAPGGSPFHPKVLEMSISGTPMVVDR